MPPLPRSLASAKWLFYGLVAIYSLSLGVITVRARPTAPDWMTAAAAKPATLPYGHAHSALLLDEDVVDIGHDGTFTHHLRVVLRVLTADGRSAAKATLGYNADTHRIKSFHAWLLRPTGDVLEYGKKETIETAAYGTGYELYGKGFRRTISADDDAESGAVFAYEAIYEEHSTISQLEWFFSGDVPVEVSRLTLRLADGWTVQEHTFNHAPLVPVVVGKDFTWEMRSVAPTRQEPAAPEPAAVQSWLAVDLRPPSDAKSSCRLPLFSWSAISSYFTPKYDAAATADSDMTAKAGALTAGNSTLTAKIESLCSYVQKTNYVSVELNEAECGGMIPQPAPGVFRCNYGDCKDKATLLRALLRAEGIEAYPAILHAGSPLHVRAEWPSPFQFNHCILAIKVDQSVDGPALLVHPRLGRLMFFDPTNTNVPFGHLPKHDCGGLAIILATGEDELVPLPALAISRYDRTLRIAFRADGSVEGSLRQNYSGPAAEQKRFDYRGQTPSEFKKAMTHWLGRSMPSPEISQLEPSDDFTHATFALKIDFSAKAYGKPMRNTLLVFKPVLFPDAQNLVLKNSRRTLPIVVSPLELTESSQITLPAGYVIDELPPPVELQSRYGTYKATIRADRDNLVLVRSLQLLSATVPASDYETIRSFYEKITQTEQIPLVLRKN